MTTDVQLLFADTRSPSFSRSDHASSPVLCHNPPSSRSSPASGCQLPDTSHEICVNRFSPQRTVESHGKSIEAQAPGTTRSHTPAGSPVTSTRSPLTTAPSPHTSAPPQVRRARSARKSHKPQKSASCWDPNFRGATLWFSTHVQGDQTQLRITSFFSKTTLKKKSFHVDKCRRHRNESVSECKSSSESEDSRESFPSVNFTAKTCASCSTRRTPLWRDAEDGTPLCNACGIRYRKYRVRCVTCWHIPKKESQTYPACSACGGMLRVNHKKMW